MLSPAYPLPASTVTKAEPIRRVKGTFWFPSPDSEVGKESGGRTRKNSFTTQHLGQRLQTPAPMMV